MFITAVPSHAQQKIAYIDSDFVMEEIPEYEGIKQRLETIAENWKEEIDEMQVEIERLRQEFEAREILFTPDVRRQRQQEIDNKVRDREQYIERRFGPEGDYFRQQEELLEPLQQRILEAVVKVAERDGYDHVFDRAGDYLFLFSRDRWDISRDVLEEMGIFVDDEDSL
ncbi:OmpH family outer membrane protein [Natronogracilivirga saccharolytica]|uniref:OmpH family outer membrane protein n=1 Tax=Natronogracilivirga saccharolytica TaxID=2812953 RepID=A0A8J7UU61_9BACT|nr:OmpH family outer membrane protein [Natronogracilivirga saccharolytica]MBP3191162.1 OmpH family outer membrane protein [Natronogracilivirga saccharolytica]